MSQLQFEYSAPGSMGSPDTGTNLEAFLVSSGCFAVLGDAVRNASPRATADGRGACRSSREQSTGHPAAGTLRHQWTSA